MDPISRKMMMKNVAGFHSFDSHDCLGPAGSGTGLFSRLQGLGTKDFQNEVSAMRGTVDTARATVCGVGRRLFRVAGKGRRRPVDCRNLLDARRSMVAACVMLR